MGFCCKTWTLFQEDEGLYSVLCISKEQAGDVKGFKLELAYVLYYAPPFLGQTAL